MTTIITVHGTNAGDPSDHGEQWWQKGSEFQERLSQLVESENGPLVFKPFHWSGGNSELERRNAARSLLKFVSRVDRQGKPFSIIGHSHGGSVTYEMLRASQLRRLRMFGRLKDKFENLASWMTIGTPFINYKKLSTIQAEFYSISAYWWTGPILLFLFASYSMMGIGVASLEEELANIGAQSDRVVHIRNWLFVFFAALTIPLFFLASKRVLRDKLRLTQTHGRKSIYGLRQKYEGHWTGLFHNSDEAINALRIANTAETKIAPANFGAGITALLLTISLAALGFGWTILTPIETLERVYRIEGPLSDAEVAQRLFTYLALWLRYTWEGIFFTDNNIVNTYFSVWALAFSFSAVVIIHTVMTPVANFIARPISRGVNSSIAKLARSKAFGVDLTGLSHPKVSTKPTDFEKDSARLPESLEKEIDQFVAKYAEQLVQRARTAMGLVQTGMSNEQILRELSDTVTWKELIHTAYFDVDGFIKLVAMDLCESGLVKPSSAFRADPDYEKIRNWHAEMRSTQP